MRAFRDGAVLGLLMAAAGCAHTMATPSLGAPAPLASTLVRSVDAVLADAYPPTSPGATAIVVKGGRAIYRKAFGLANVELQVEMRPEHVFAIASLSKHITAAAILKLAEQGKLSIDDPITKFLPAYPTHSARITIEHLLTHTSGINALSETSDLRAVATQEGKLVDVLGDWVKDLPADSAPGERWAYSNWGYNLLAAIIEQASGQTYPEFLQTQFFGPVGLAHTYYSDRRRVIPLRATGYDAPDSGVSNVLQPRSRIFHPGGAGSLLSTIDDLSQWNYWLLSGRVLSRSSLDRMFTPYRLKDGTSTRYGYGWDIGEYDRHRVYEHAGGTTGYVSYMIALPDDDLFICILSNKASAAVPIQTIAHRVAAIAMGHPIPEPRAVALPADSLDRLVATYVGDDVGTCTVKRAGERLLADVAGLEKLELIPVGPLTFRASRVTWTFVFELDEAGRGVRLHVTDWKLDDVARRTEQAAPKSPVVVDLDGAQLDACAGEYESLNGILVSVTRVGGSLEVRPAGQPPVQIVPVAADTFFTADGSVGYTFVRNSAGVVTGFLRTAAGRPSPARRLGVSRPPTTGPVPR